MDQRSGIGLEKNPGPAAVPHVSASLMRLSVPARFAIALLLSLLLWAAIYWALA